MQFIFCKKYRKTFFRKGKRQNLNTVSTLCNGHEKREIKNVDLRNKITSMECSLGKKIV